MQTPAPHRVPVARLSPRPVVRESIPLVAGAVRERPRVHRSLVLRPDEYLAIVAAGRRVD
jgi:hypothetical protein